MVNYPGLKAGAYDSPEVRTTSRSRLLPFNMKALKAKELIGQVTPWLVLNIGWLWLHESGHYGTCIPRGVRWDPTHRGH